MAQAPYKILFCIGIIYGLLGTWCWIFVRLGWMPYPLFKHAEWMVLGFLLSFATGFLMTAIPRFLNAPVCELWELIAASVLAMLPFGGLWASAEWIAWGGILQLGWLMFFGMKRILKRSFLPPPSFVFLPVGILSGLVGCIFIGLNPSAPGRVLLYEGMMLAFVLGIGSKLVTALLGWSKPIQVQLIESRFWKNSDSIFFIEAIAFGFGSLFHALGRAPMGDLCWSLVATSVGFRLWKVYRLPQARGSLAYILWLSTIFIIVGLWLVVAFPAHRIHMMHFIYIGGMALMTLMIATRVILSHGGYSLDLELNSRPLLIIGCLFLFAAATRVSAPFIQNELYFSHLAYAGGTLSLAFLVWGAMFLKKIFKSSSELTSK